jgi:hypothetical protein
VTSNGTPCRTKGGYLAQNTKKHRYLLKMQYVRTGPSGTRWRKVANDTDGIDRKVCAGYGTNVLYCDYSREFTVGR